MCRNMDKDLKLCLMIPGYLLARSQELIRNVSASFFRAVLTLFRPGVLFDGRPNPSVLTLFQPPHLGDTPG